MFIAWLGGFRYRNRRTHAREGEADKIKCITN